jgi:hypothetical protein
MRAPPQTQPGARPAATASCGLRSCERGVTAVEFALIAPVLLLLLCGIIEFSMITFVSTTLESATSITSRLGKTGYAAAGKTRQEHIMDTINHQTAGLLDPAKITITTRVYSDFSKVGQPEPCISPVNPPCSGTAGVHYVDANGNGQWDSDMGAAGLGNGGDVVVYTVNYPWPVLTPMAGAVIGNTYNITARTVVRNEPFTGGPGGR